MSDHKLAPKEYQIVHPIFPSGNYQKIEKNLVFLDWYVPLISLIVIFVILKVFVYQPDEKRKDQ